MGSVLSVYLGCDNAHWRDEDFAYINALDPNWVRINQFSALSVHRTQKAAPSTKVLLRSWDIDDADGNRKREAYANPVGAAQLHMDLWERKLDATRTELARNGYSHDESRWWLGLVNEPDTAYLPMIITYTRECLRIAEVRGRKLGVAFHSVGTPQLPSEGPNNLGLWANLAPQIMAGGHIFVLHEYWQPDGPSAVWVDDKGKTRVDAGFLSWRHLHMPFTVPLLIGEAGANGYIYQRYSQRDDSGWRRFMDPVKYAQQVKEYISGCREDVQGVCLYRTDFDGEQWWSFDTNPAHGELLKIRAVTPQAKLPGTVQTRPYINADAGANLREGPGTEYPVVRALPKGTAVNPTYRNAQGDWVKLRAGEWVFSALVSNLPKNLPVAYAPQPVPQESVLVWPVDRKYPITHWYAQVFEGIKYETNRGHTGIDLATPVGAAVVAPADGEVAFSGSQVGGFGTYLRIWHPQFRFHSFFAHLENVLVPVGAKVKCGQVVARTGNSGYSSGPHLHYEVRIADAKGTYEHVPGMATPQADGRVDPYAFHAGVERALAATGRQQVFLPIVVAPDGDTYDPLKTAWERAINFLTGPDGVSGVEGGWADDPDDPGGATMGGVTLATFSRWRAAMGMPTPSKADLRASTPQERAAIFKAWYWDESGANALPWPLSLVHFDLAVHSGSGKAADVLARSNGDWGRYVDIREAWLRTLSTFPKFGAGWLNRIRRLREEASKPL